MLVSGCVKVTQTGLSGNEVILRLNGAGEIVGSFRLCTQCNHCSTAQAVQPSTALVWDASIFEKLLVSVPTFRRNTFRALEERLRDMEQRFREVSTEKVGSRLEAMNSFDCLTAWDELMEIRKLTFRARNWHS